jgi:hypothetical protein
MEKGKKKKSELIEENKVRQKKKHVVWFRFRMRVCVVCALNFFQFFTTGLKSIIKSLFFMNRVSF